VDVTAWTDQRVQAVTSTLDPGRDESARQSFAFVTAFVQSSISRRSRRGSVFRHVATLSQLRKSAEDRRLFPIELALFSETRQIRAQIALLSQTFVLRRLQDCGGHLK